MQPIINYIKHPSRLALGIIKKTHFLYSDSLYLSLYFYLQTGKRLHLNPPQTFSEKLQWLKLHDRNSLYTKLVDKYAVKEYVANIIGKEHIIPTIGMWNKPEDINFDQLPDQFVLKATHSGGGNGVVICKEKKSFDRQKALSKLKKSLEENINIGLKEYPYKNVPKRIIAEQYIQPSSEKDDLPDYKFFCFNGVPQYCQVISGRGTKMCIDFFDHNWIHQPFHEPHFFPFADIEPSKPQCFKQMWTAAAKLAQDRPFVRIDFYEADGQFYFGEITFFPTSGMGGFEPDEWDYKLGEMIHLPSLNTNK